jgi:hypothetical protein
MEKIHGTSAHITFKTNPSNINQWQVTFFSGGESYDKFVSLFDKDVLLAKFIENGFPVDKEVTIYGEAYGGKQQGMSDTYGKTLKFIAFDVQIGDCWLDVPKADNICQHLGIEFVYYVKVSTDLKELDAQRDADSVQAIRNGITDKKIREGIVLRPLIELTKNNGSRIICKHKRDEFRETKSPRPVDDPAKLKVLDDANKIADEYVTVTRLEHVLDKIPDHSIEQMSNIIKAMVEDVTREGQGEIVDNDATRKAVGRKTALMYKDYIKNKLYEKV